MYAVGRRYGIPTDLLLVGTSISYISFSCSYLLHGTYGCNQPFTYRGVAFLATSTQSYPTYRSVSGLHGGWAVLPGWLASYPSSSEESLYVDVWHEYSYMYSHGDTVYRYISRELVHSTVPGNLITCTNTNSSWY